MPETPQIRYMQRCAELQNRSTLVQSCYEEMRKPDTRLHKAEFKKAESFKMDNKKMIKLMRHL